MTTYQASSALAFTDSIGINAGIDHDASDADQNASADENALAYLDVKLIRGHSDFLDVATDTQWNHDLGIKFDLTVNGGSTASFNSSLQMIEANASIVAYVEGPNESDEPAWKSNYNGLTGLPATAAEMQVLYTTVHSDSNLKGAGVIQASFGLPTSFAKYGNHAGTADYANAHIYFYGTDPLGGNPGPDGTTGIQNLLAEAQLVTPGVPNIVTETGYETLAGSDHGVSQIDQAKYLLEAVFDLWNSGVVKSFIYNLVDPGPNSADPLNVSNNYGLYNADWTPKPAAIALHNLLTLLNEGTGDVAPGSLNYTLSGQPSTVQTTLLEKSDGRFVIAIWNEVRLQNASGADAVIPDVPVTLTLDGIYKSITIYDPLTGTSAVQTFSNAQTVTIMVPDYPVLIDISKTAPAPAVAAANQPVINAPAEILGAADSIIQVGGLSIGNDQLGNITVQVTDSLGTLWMRDANNQALTGSGTDTITLSGSAAIVNAELATLAYAAPSAGGDDAISLQVTGATGAVASKFIAVNLINRPASIESLGPLLSVPTTMTVAAGSDSAVTDIVLTDDYYDLDSGSLQLTVAASYGKIDMVAAGVALTPATSLTVTGTYAQLAADLQTLTYLAGSAPGRHTLSFRVTNLNAATGAGGFTTTASVAITVAPALAIDGPSAITVAEGTGGTVGIQIDDADAPGNADQVQVTIGDSAGTLTMLGSNGQALPGSGTHTITVTGTSDQINSELATLVENAPNSLSNDEVTFSIKNSAGATATGSVAVTVVPQVAITAPVILEVTSAEFAPVGGVSVTDSYAVANGLQETVTVSDTHGTLSMTDSAGDAIAGSGSNSITLTGSVAVVNAELATLIYTTPLGIAPDSILITAGDTAGGSSSQSIEVPVSASPLASYFQLSDTAADPTSRQPFLSSGGMVLTTAATGLNGAVSEQVTGGVTTLTAEQWNTVYGVTIVDATGDSYALDDFRFINATLGAGPTAAGQAQTLTVDTAQNGTVTLGTGNQNVVINAGLGGAAVGTGNTFDIIEGSGADALTVNGYAGYLPTTNVADITNAIVTAGSGTETMTFVDTHAAITAGAGALTILGSNYGTHVIAGAGTVDVTGGGGYNLFNYAAGDGLMTIEDYTTQDGLSLDRGLQAFITQSVVSDGILLSFANSPQGGILLKGLTSFSLSSITWTGVASDVPNSAGQTIGISAPGAITVSATAIVPLSGISITDSDAAANGLQETVIVKDSYGKLSMTNSAGTAIAGSGGHLIEIAGTVAVVNAELATLTYSAPTGTAPDSISIGAADTAGGSSSQSIAVPITGSGPLPSYFELSDTADDPISRQPLLGSGTLVLTPAASGLNGTVREQVAGGVTTLTAEQWNTVYGVTMVDATGDSYALDDFRYVNATLKAGPTAAGQAQTLTVNTAQSGTVTLGSGDQNVVINAGLGGPAVGTGKTFNITEGSGIDMLTVNGYAGYLPTSDIADITTAVVTAGSGTEDMTFVNAHAAITAGSGNLTIYGSNYGTHVIAGTGSVDVWGGSGNNLFNYAAGDGVMTIEDFSKQDTLSLNQSLRAGMTTASVSGGIELLFSSSPHGEIVLKGQTSTALSQINWAS